MNNSIKKWPEQERPRERLLRQGAHSLSDAELLAIFLRSGSQQHSAVELSRLMLKHFGNINAVFDAPLNEISQFHGMAETKYAQLMAVKELGRRYLQHQLSQQIDLSRSDLIQNYLRYELLGESQEIFAVLCLDAGLRKINFKKLFFGSTNQCSVSINQFIRHLIHHQASAAIIAHNHPLGVAKPSIEDINLTKTLARACDLVEIKLIDHVIVSNEGCYSFSEHQLIKK